MVDHILEMAGLGLFLINVSYKNIAKIRIPLMNAAS